MKPGSIEVVIDVDTEHLTHGLLDAEDRMAMTFASGRIARARAAARLHRRHLTTAADVFTATAQTRGLWDPRRLTERWHADACRRAAAELGERLEDKR